MSFEGMEKATPDEDIALAIQGIKLTPENHADRAARLSSLSQQYVERYKREGDPESLKHALSFANDAIKAAGEDAAQIFELRYNRSCIAWMQYQETNQRQWLDEAITDALKAYGSDVKRISRESMQNLEAHLSTLLFNRYELCKNLSDLDKAIELARQAVAKTTDGNPARPSRLSSLGEMLFNRYQWTSEEEDLSKAISTASLSLSLTASSDNKRPSRMSSVAVMQLHRFYLTGDTETLETSVDLARGAVNSVSEDDPTYIGVLNNFVIILTIQYSHTGDVKYIDAAISLARKALNRKESATLLNNLGTVLLSRYEITGNESDLDHAISATYKAIESTPDNHIDMPARRSNISNMLLRRYERNKAEKDLKDAVFHAREAFNKTPESSHSTARRLSSLSNVLSKQYEQTRSLETLEEAINFGRRSLDLTYTSCGEPTEKKGKMVSQDYYPDLPSCLKNLVSLLFTKYMRTGEAQALDEAISQLREGLKHMPESQRDYATLQNELGSMLLTRYEKFRIFEDLENAIRHTGKAIHITTPDVEERLIPKPLVRLSSFSRSPLLRSAATLLHGISVVEKRDESEDRAAYFSNLSTMLSLRFDKGDDKEDLNKAIYLARKAMRATPDQHAELPGRLRHLGNLLMRRYRLANQQRDLDECGTIAGKLDEVLEGDFASFMVS